jgi:hypothetical protein
MEVVPPQGCSADGDISERIRCIVTYGGHTPDIVVNYFMLAMNWIGCMALLPPARHIFSFVFAWIFQIGLCLGLAYTSDDGMGCAGISIVWCAMAGWMWQQQQQRQHQPTLRKRSSQDNPLLWRLLVVSNVLVVGYYYVTEEMITTVAHVLAVILGILLSWLLR